MTVEELLEMLHDLPVDALNKEIHIIDSDAEDLAIEPITQNDEVVGYVLVALVPEDPRQLKLPLYH